LASKKPYLGTSEDVDLAFYLTAFEAMNNVRLVFTMMAVDTGGLADLELLLVVLPRVVTSPDQKPLTSVKRRYLGMNLRTLHSALIQLMYAADFQLAELELGRMEPK